MIDFKNTLSVQRIGALTYEDIKDNMPDWERENKREMLGNHCIHHEAVRDFCDDNDIRIPEMIYVMIAGLWTIEH